MVERSRACPPPLRPREDGHAHPEGTHGTNLDDAAGGCRAPGAPTRVAAPPRRQAAGSAQLASSCPRQRSVSQAPATRRGTGGSRTRGERPREPPHAAGAGQEAGRERHDRVGSVAVAVAVAVAAAAGAGVGASGAVHARAGRRGHAAGAFRIVSNCFELSRFVSIVPNCSELFRIPTHAVGHALQETPLAVSTRARRTPTPTPLSKNEPTSGGRDAGFANPLHAKPPPPPPLAPCEVRVRVTSAWLNSAWSHRVSHRVSHCVSLTVSLTVSPSPCLSLCLRVEGVATNLTL
jgi:hypothetical protein